MILPPPTTRIRRRIKSEAKGIIRSFGNTLTLMVTTSGENRDNRISRIQAKSIWLWSNGIGSSEWIVKVISVKDTAEWLSAEDKMNP